MLLREFRNSEPNPVQMSTHLSFGLFFLNMILVVLELNVSTGQLEVEYQAVVTGSDALLSPLILTNSQHSLALSVILQCDDLA